ncbi:MAG: RNA polymerase sigma factor FliA, partial [Pontibacterium sp.]
MYSQLQQQTSDQLVKDYAPLVKRIAYHLLARLPANVVLEDLIQAGMIGLLEAASKYDPSKGASFETYAGIRIRGSIIDEVRRGDWTPRSVHRNARRVSEAIRQVEARTGRDASDASVAKELGISVDEYHNLLKDSADSRLFSLEELTSTDGESPGEQIESKDET